MTTMEQSIKMKKILVKAIVGLVYRNCMISAEDFAMVEFIIKHCGGQGPANASTEDVSDFQDACKSSLILMCNTVTSVRVQLRNLLLHALTIEDFTPSISSITHCLTTLLQNNSEIISDEQPNKDFELKLSPELVFVRCITHLAEPDQAEKNKNLLVFLEEYSGDVHKNLKNSWNVEIERLIKFAESNESTDQWHSMLLDLLVSAIEQVNSNKWVETITTLLSQQVLSKKQTPMVKNVSLQYMAVLSCHMTNAAIVETILKVIIFALKMIPLESCEYVSKAVGIASRQHGEFILNELDGMYKENESKRSSKILNFLSARHSRSDAELSTVKYAIIICYGKVAAECLDVHVLARLGDNVTKTLLDILKSNPSFDLCNASVTTLYEISRALYPACHHNVTLRNRWQLLNAVLEQIYNSNLEKRNVELYPIIVKASKSLTKLQKGILAEERNTILRVLFNSIFGELSSYKKKYEVEGDGDKNDLLAKTLNDSLALLNSLIKELIIQSTCLSTIDDLVTLLMEWIRHENDEIRTASYQILYVVLDTYIKNVKLNYETPSKFGQMGYFLGLTVPGLVDKNFAIRLIALDCIKVIIQIQDLYEGHTIEPDDECIVSLTKIQNNILTNDLNMVDKYCMRLCDAISSKIPHHYTMQFIESLLEGYDDEELRSSGISASLEALFLKRGQDLYQSVERIVELILKTMDEVQSEALVKLLKPLVAVARHHSHAVTAVLLAQRMPLKESVNSCWRSLARDESLSIAIVDNFLRLMNSIEIFEDPYHITENHVAALQPLTLISALGEMLKENTMSPICDAKFSELFTVLYTTLACYLDAEPPAYAPTHNKAHERFGFIPNRDSIKLSPSKITLNTFNAFLERADCVKVKEACSVWSSVEHGGAEGAEGALAELAALVAGALCAAHVARVARLAAAAAQFARAPLPPQRAAAVSLLAELLNYSCAENPVVVETVLSSLGAGWRDGSARVRAAALRGAARAAGVRGAGRGRALPGALHALSEGVDAEYAQSPSQNVPLAAIQGLSQLLAELEEANEWERELMSIAQKIRPFMNTECAQLREGSIKLFGIIAGKVQCEALAEQAISSLPCFLLHLSDSNPAVVRASKYTLKQVFRGLDAKQANALVQMHLVDEGRLCLEEFLRALVRRLGAELPAALPAALQATLNYLSCGSDAMRPYPPLLIGLLYSELQRIRTPQSETVDGEVSALARARLLQLTAHAQPAVRLRAAHALAELCLYVAGTPTSTHMHAHARLTTRVKSEAVADVNSEETPYINTEETPYINTDEMADVKRNMASNVIKDEQSEEKSDEQYEEKTDEEIKEKNDKHSEEKSDE